MSVSMFQGMNICSNLKINDIGYSECDSFGIVSQYNITCYVKTELLKDGESGEFVFKLPFGQLKSGIVKVKFKGMCNDYSYDDLPCSYNS